MKCNLSLMLLLLCAIVFSQNKTTGIVIDVDDKQPLEFVSVFNSKDHTVTNEDGRFQFSSENDSITFYSPGYEKLKTNSSSLKDTVFLHKSVFKLDEVVVTNAKTILQRIKDSISVNYKLTPHTETFFIRALLRRNDTIVRLQDMQGRLKRKTSIYTGDINLEKKDYEVALLQMRQVGIKKDKNNVYFVFPSFFKILSEFIRINAMGPDFIVVEKPLINTDEIKVEFSPETQDNSGGSRGHYIINTKDNAILSFNVSTEQIFLKSLKKESEYDKTVFLESATYFKKDPTHNRYYINYAKQKMIVASKTKEQKEPTRFQIEIILHTTEPFTNAVVKSNVNEHKDIFKLKIPYDKEYWDSQNQLLLTNEMKQFLTKMDEDDREFKIRGNLD